MARANFLWAGRHCIVACGCYAVVMQLLSGCYAPAMQLLSSCYALAMHLL